MPPICSVRDAERSAILALQKIPSGPIWTNPAATAGGIGRADLAKGPLYPSPRRGGRIPVARRVRFQLPLVAMLPLPVGCPRSPHLVAAASGISAHTAPSPAREVPIGLRAPTTAIAVEVVLVVDSASSWCRRKIRTTSGRCVGTAGIRCHVSHAPTLLSYISLARVDGASAARRLKVCPRSTRPSGGLIQFPSRLR
jgi:hypothetical protein